MALTIDELNIQIAAESKQATQALDNLIQRLNKLLGVLNSFNNAGNKIGSTLDNMAGKSNKAANSFVEAGNKISSALNKVSEKSDKAETSLGSYNKQVENSKSTEKLSDKLKNTINKFESFGNSLKNVWNTFKPAIEESNKYIETVNLFNVTMGDGADKAREYAESVESLMGVDLSEWMNYQGIFKQLAGGFGVSSDKANVMSQNLTQLSYDLSSFFNTDVETAFDKLSSAMTGQVKGLREFGIDTTVATLQEYALSKGINKSVSSMTQAEKSLLRYNYIMEQTTHIQGDMAKTIATPANAMRILEAQINRLKRAFGNVLSVIVAKLIPYIQAFVEIMIEAANKLAELFNFKLPEMDSGSGKVASDYAAAEESAENIKKQLMGTDELNLISTSSSESSSATDSGMSTLNIDPREYNFLENLDTSSLDDVKEKLKDVLNFVLTIASGFAAWKISNGLVKALEFIKGLKSKNFSFGFSLVGSTSFIADLNELKKYIEDFSENGPTFSNVAGIISEFAGLIGDSLMILGKVETAAAFKAVQGIGEIISAIADMSKEGVNWDNVMTAIRGLSNVGIAVGIFTKNPKLTGVSMFLQGLTTIINELATNWEAIKKGDFSGIDEATFVIGAIQALGGIVFALNGLNNLKNASDLSKTTTTLTEVRTATETINTGTSTLTSKLKDLATNLGWGILIIAEVAVAAGIIVGAIWGLGVLLEQVGIAWQPVIDNGATIAIAMGIGIGLLAAIGVVTGLLGSLGGAMAGQMGIGIAILAEIGVAAGLFIAEIWAIGWGLDQIGIAWQPVIDNGETIATGIGIGTGILVGIGVVTAALGVATVASAGLLPLAIGLGTAILLELGAATLLFIAEIWAIGKGLDELGKAWQPVLDNGDTISSGIEKGTELLIAIGVVTAALGVASVASVGLLPLAIALGTDLLVDLGDAVVDFNDSLVKVANSLGNKLYPSLGKLNDKLPPLSEYMDDFTAYMKIFAGQVVNYTESSAISGFSSTVDSIIKFFTKDPIKSLADDANKQYTQALTLNKKLKLANPELNTSISLMKKYYTFLEEIEKLTQKTNNISLANGMFTSMKEVGKNLVTGFVDGIKSKNSDLSAGVKSVLGNAFSESVANSYGYDFGKKLGASIAKGFKGTSFPTLKGFIDVATSGKVNLKLQAYAYGGFPTTGEMFIAREAGPELVGSIGRKTAVANNDQIVSGIESGVYRAMVAANSGSGGKAVTVNATFEMDGEVIGRKVIKYHNGVVMQTGASPLLV